MFRKTFITLFAIALFFGVSSAQNNKLTQWEYLEVSGPKYSSDEDHTIKYYRDYNYLTSVTFFIGQNSLEWMKNSGWELVSVVNNGESPVSMFFKRPFEKTRTDNEIARLKEGFESVNQVPQKPAQSALVDLDEQEFQQKLADFNKRQETRLRTALEQVKNLPLKIISVQSKSSRLDGELSKAEIVLDATAVLLKDGKNYRSSEADKYYRDSVRRILDSIGVISNSNLDNTAKNISKGQPPTPIGKFSYFGSEVAVYTSVIININGQQSIISQGMVSGEWIKR